MIWKKELAHDLIALGSYPFYFLVVLRAIIGKSTPFIAQLLIALVALFFLTFFIKKPNLHIARSMILLVFISLFYIEPLFTVGAALVWFSIIISAIFLRTKRTEISHGILAGGLSSLVGYFLTKYLLLGFL